MIAALSLLLYSFAGAGVRAQVPYGHSDPGTQIECGAYQWPLHQSPCPEVQIKQKHDHTPFKQYRAQGWDTVVTCSVNSLMLSCMPFLPVKFFNGQYTVDIIPYNPPDPTFAGGMGGINTKMPVTTDDDFASDSTAIPFSFYFFGLRKTAFVLGANGLITFNTGAAGKYCPWRFSTPLPWYNGKSGAPKALDCTQAFMRDAIYGIYEDTHPIASYLTGDQGIYYGIQGEAPCRKIICSWNGIPVFPGSRNLDNRCTYQIVCYEGSNIIEVHVKHRGINPNWEGGHGILGIQNATGQPQVTGDIGTTTMFVDSAAHPDYYPVGGNPITTTLDTIAYRFSPCGEPVIQSRWVRIFDDGRPDYELPSDDIYDTNGYCTPMGDVMATCPNLTIAMVSPTCVSRYAFQLTYWDADQVAHFIADTITIGVDTSHALTLRPAAGRPGDTTMNICAGQHANLMIEYPSLQDTVHTTLNLFRINGGTAVPLPDSLLVRGTLYEDEETSLKRIPAMLLPDEVAMNLQPGEVDSVRIVLNVDFTSGISCPTTVSFLLRTFPSYDTIEHDTICQGDTYHWPVDGRDYTVTTTAPRVVMHTAEAGCDSTVHLHLKVNPTDIYVEHIDRCSPLVWHGRTYSVTNTATAATDTAHLLNRYGCDSLVRLDLVVTPMTPAIGADLDYFDLDHLDVVLTDRTVGGITRRWLMPDNTQPESPVVYYTIPYDADSALIGLEATSPYGCVDTVWRTFPFRKDVLWMPNVFLPDNPNDEPDSRFAAAGTHLLRMEMLVYNRRGELVFRCHEPYCPWDGNNLDGNPCPQGSYVYIIRYTTDYDPATTRVAKGAVTLLR